MSYDRNFSKIIYVPVDVEVRDPEVHTSGDGNVSISNGSVVVTVGDRREDYVIFTHGNHHGHNFEDHEHVNVNIHVDTEPYDTAVNQATTQVNVLTGSVVATEAAQVASIKVNSERIASTIIRGFFKNVQSDISAQVMELSKKVESRLMHLAEQAKELKNKQAQMEKDYRRTSERYVKIFDDLNRELENRIKALDMPIYQMHDNVQAQTDRMLNSDFVNVSSVTNAENGILESQISAAITKGVTLETIKKIQQYLFIQNQTDKVIGKTTVTPIDNGEQYYMPICFLESVNPGGSTNKQCLMQEKIPAKTKQLVERECLDEKSKAYAFNAEQQEQILPYLSSEVDGVYGGSANPHSERVKETIFRLFKK